MTLSLIIARFEMPKTRKRSRAAADTSNSPAPADTADDHANERFVNSQLLFYRLIRNNFRSHSKRNIFLEILSRSVKKQKNIRGQIIRYP